MCRIKIPMAFMAAIVMIGPMAGFAQPLDIVWDGGAGQWDDPNWNGGMLAIDLTGSKDGSNGYASLNGGETYIISGSDSTVAYDANFLSSDFRIKQGSSMRIENGGTWSQPTNSSWSENRWTQFDGDALVIDGGTFSRLGSVPGEGGGALLFGSWRGDDNFDHPLSVLDHQETHITITNGGRLENEGQLWFGGWEDHAPGLVVSMTINNGTLDLTGGDILGVGDAGDADLVFTYGRTNLGEPKGESYSINFTGPGSITVDSGGIIVAEKDEFNTWNGGFDFLSYEDLWNRGILQANGQSGLVGADFGEFFTVSGEVFFDDYMLTSLVMPSAGLAGDYNGNNQVEQADLDLVLLNWGTDGTTPPNGWINDLPSGNIDQEELDKVLLNWGNTAGLGGTSAVPEPSSWAVLCIVLATAGAWRKMRGR